MTASGEWPWESGKRRSSVGLVNLNIPEEYGGVGASVLEECIVGEELAYGCSGIQTALMLNQLATLPMLIAGNDEQKQKLLPAPHRRRQDHGLLHDRAGRRLRRGRHQDHGGAQG
jgi:alkylation response protein AidB-like acyl-CoA dehydrogenase